MPRAQRIDHVSIAVPKIDEAVPFFEKLFDVQVEKVRRFGGGGEFNGAIFHVGENRFELLEPIDDNGFVARFLNSRGPGVHHVTVQVEDLAAMRTRLKEMGVTTWGKEDSEGMPEAFIHPRDAFGVLFQLVERVWEVEPQD